MKNVRIASILIFEAVIFGLLAVKQEWFFFQLLLVSQIMLAIVLLSVHRQQNAAHLEVFAPKKVLYVTLPMVAFGGLSFVFSREWNAPSTWAQASQVLTRQYNEITILVGLAIGTLSLIGSLAIQRRRRW